MRCSACGAGIAPTDLSCPYCGQVTAQGAWHAKQAELQASVEAAAALAEQQRQRLELQAQAKTELDRSATRALFWSLGGLVLCCAFVPSIVGIAMALRARKLAHAHGLPIPSSVTVALVMAILGPLCGAGLIAIGALDSQKREARIAEIDATLGDAVTQAELTQKNACLLAEKRFLTDGFEGNKSFDRFECDGKLLPTQARAVLNGMRVTVSSKPLVLSACLSKGERWSVAGFSRNECKEPEFTGP
ncbi:MAG TPA: zinc ribbon domain-containing protein [Polyangiaceae bacterium]|nr:zinc ribbon domain-containing protein [Polyangiaceae bacterium]